MADAGHAADATRADRSRAAAASHQSKQRVISMNSDMSTAGFPFESGRQAALIARLPVLGIPWAEPVAAAGRPRVSSRRS
jgi:hypothetical protein